MVYCMTNHHVNILDFNISFRSYATKFPVLLSLRDLSLYPYTGLSGRLWRFFHRWKVKYWTLPLISPRVECKNSDVFIYKNERSYWWTFLVWYTIFISYYKRCTFIISCVIREWYAVRDTIRTTHYQKVN